MKVPFDTTNVHVLGDDRVHYTEDVMPGYEPYEKEEIEKLISDYLKDEWEEEFRKKDEVYPVRVYSLKKKKFQRKDFFSNFNKHFD